MTRSTSAVVAVCLLAGAGDAWAKTAPAPLVAPTNAVATPVSDTVVHLAWNDNAADETGYQVYRCQGAGCSAFALVATVAANARAFDDGGRTAHTAYRYRVRAVRGTKASSFSNTANVVTLDAPPPPPPPPPAEHPPSAAFGIWTPSTRDTCSKALHDSYAVVGPDGKLYPTWHPPTAVENGADCSFGHEHGRDPRQSQLWATRQIQRFFYFDANANGVMDPEEEAVTGVPFGYVNERMDAYYQALGQHVMRHEDHVGHKIDFVNGEGDLATHQMSSATTGGAWVGKLGDGVVANDTGARCYYFAKVHQGVSTADAFTNNLHEVLYLADCRHPDPAYDQEVNIAQMMAFNRPGGFTKFMPMCGVERRGDAQDFVDLGTNSMNEFYPAGPGDREIISRDCIETGFLVPQGQWSGNLYEAWSASLEISDYTGRRIASGINLLFDVEDANRYFYPEDLKALRGYTNPAAGTNRGFTMDLCYDRSLESVGRRYRGGPCDRATNYGQITGITWDDPRSAFRGLHRGMYFMPATLDNRGGALDWYTDPFGRQGTNAPFPGAVRQRVTRATMNYSSLIGGLSIDPRVTDREHEDGHGSVHAPN
jgi:hypothetical protein